MQKNKTEQNKTKNPNQTTITTEQFQTEMEASFLLPSVHSARMFYVGCEGRRGKAGLALFELHNHFARLNVCSCTVVA